MVKKFRRQTEILNQYCAAKNTALQENDKLVVELAKLKTLTDCLDDDEAKQIMGQL
jgi:hypothetical protein